MESNKYILGLFWFIMNLVMSVMNDVIVKTLGSRLPFAEVAFLRFLFGTLSLVPFILYYGKPCLKTSKASIHIVRGLLLFVAINMWSLGLNIVPIATVTVMSFTLPMFVLILAYIFLKEQVTWKLWTATVVGFIGIYIILTPSTQKLNPFCLALVAAALMFATLDIINKKFIIQETMLGMLFYSASVTTLLGIYPAHMVWVTPTYRELFLLSSLGIGSNAILYCILKAFSYVPASSVAPYRYLELLMSIFLGYILFGEVPEVNTYIGCAIIIPASLFIAYEYMKPKLVLASKLLIEGVP